VPKKIKTMGNVFYGLVAALDPALDAGDAAALATILERNVYGAPHAGIASLAAYLVDQSRELTARPVALLTHTAEAAA
jgi:cytochrome b pre-mRNA-processing protein 3